MGSKVLATLSINILSNFLSDLLKRSRGNVCTPVDSAIARTAGMFPQVEGLKGTLEEWLLSPTVTKVLDQYTKGLTGVDDVKVELLAEDMTSNTRFFFPGEAEAIAAKIVSTFLTEVRDEYLKIPELALRIIANRVEENSVRSAVVLNGLTESLGEMKARLQPAATTHDGPGFDAQIDEARGYLQAYDYDLAEHACDKLRRHNWDLLNSRQKFGTLSISAAAKAAQGKTSDGAQLFIEAKGWQPDDDKALANEARGFLLLGQDERAFELAARTRERFPNSTLALTVWLNAAPISSLLKDLEAAVPAHLSEDIEVVSALARRSLMARDYLKAEALARRATTIKADWSFPWALLGESIFRSELGDTPEDYSRLDALVDKGRLREADDACTKAVDLSKTEKQVGVQAGTLLIRAEIRRALGDQSAGDEDVITAWSLQPNDLTVLREYVRAKLQRGQIQGDILKLRQAVKCEGRNDLRMLLALALDSTGKEEDSAEATRIYEALATQEHMEPAGFRTQAILATLGSLSKSQRWQEGRDFLARLPSGSLSDAASAAMQAKWELTAGNREKASELASKAATAITADTSPEDLRLAATLLADLGRHREALPLWQRLASPRRLGYDTSRLVDCALRLGQHDVFLTLCEQLRSNGIYDRKLVEVEAGVRTHYDVESAISVLQEYLSRFTEDRVTRMRLSAIGLQLGRRELVTSDPSLLPLPDDVPPEDWKLIVHVMKSGGHLMEALRFAYRVLRHNFGEAEAHRAYLAAMLVTGPRPDIPNFDVAAPGTAIAFREEGAIQEEWRVIEEEFAPDPGLQEIGPDHFIAQQAQGKRVREEFLTAEGPVMSTRATITQILSKYVYRFQDCTANWQKRFPGLPDIQSMRVVKIGPGGSQEIDLTGFFASMDRIVANQQEAISAYRSEPIPIHLLAQALSHSEFEQTIRLAIASDVSLRCCAGSAQERAEAILALKNASAIVLDLTGIATLSLLDALDELGQFPCPVLVSELTFTELLKSHATLTSTDCEMGFLGKEGDRYVLERAAPEIAQRRREFLQSVIDKVRSKCRIIGCPEFAAVPPDKREFLIKTIGEHGAQTAVLSSAPDRVLWTDDFGLAMVVRHELGVRRIWTQVALQERTEAGAMKPDVFFEATAKLIGWGYYFTSPSTPAIVRAGSLADWNPGQHPLKSALELFSDQGIATRDALALAVSFMVHYSTEVVLPEVRNALTVQILENLAKRADGLTLTQALKPSLSIAFGLNVLRAGEFVRVINAWLTIRQPIGWR